MKIELYKRQVCNMQTSHGLLATVQGDTGQAIQADTVSWNYDMLGLESYFCPLRSSDDCDCAICNMESATYDVVPNTK